MVIRNFFTLIFTILFTSYTLIFFTNFVRLCLSHVILFVQNVVKIAHCGTDVQAKTVFNMAILNFVTFDFYRMTIVVV